MRRTVSMFLTVGVMVGVWLLLFQLVGLVDFNSPLNLSNRSASVSTAKSKDSTTSYDRLVEQVVPADGKTIKVIWGNMGQRLINAGPIDLNKFQSQYGTFSDEQREI